METMTPTTSHSPIHSIAVAAHPGLPEALAECPRICAYLEEHGLRVMGSSLYDEKLRSRVQAGEFDVLLALGGDGTMLRAAHLCAPLGIPVLGINLGHFGFLMQVQREDWTSAVDRMLLGEYWLENRMMLHVDHYRGEALMKSWDNVLNEVVVTRSELVRPLRLSASVDGYLLTTYVADALIAATATGSTAYAMAAGGPIMPPELRNILIVPVAPHLSMDRAIILSEGATVSITVYTNYQAVVSVDGQAPLPMLNGDRVQVNCSGHTVRFIRFQDPGYFYRNLIAHMEQNPTRDLKP